MSPACALAVAAAWLVAPMTRTGAWDPVEAETADLARRIAVHAFEADGLARAGDPPSMPTLTDLGMGELPFTSMALSFRLFGFHEWSGRLPMALWALAGAMSLYAFIHRLVHPRAAFLSVVALVTLPLYFLHARTMAGDIVTMASLSIAVSGLGLFFGDDAWSWRVGGLALGLGGMVAGFLTRGILVGVAAPMAAVTVAALATGARHGPSAAAWARGVAALSLAVSIVLAFWFVRIAAPRADRGEPLLRLVGMTLFDPTPRDSTFERILRQLGHAAYPWSALVPIAVSRLVREPPAGAAPQDGVSRTTFAKAVLLSGASVAFAATTLVVPWAGAIPYPAAAMLAGALGIMAFEMEWEGPSRTAAFVGLSFVLVLAVDMDREPARSLAAFRVDANAFPTSFVPAAKASLMPVAAVAAFAALFSFFDGRVGETSTPIGSIREELAKWLDARRHGARGLGRALYDAFRGNVVFLAVIAEAWLVGQAAMIAVGNRAGWEQIRKLPTGLVTILVNAWWGVPLGLVTSAVAFVLVRDAVRALLRVGRISRGVGLVLAMGAAGTFLSFSYYPSLGEQLSPRGAFEVYRGAKREGEPIALLGTSPRAGALYFAEPLPAFDDVVDASTWLSEEGAPRRFLVLKAKDLPRLNSIWRARHRKSVAVLDSRSTQNVLVSNVGGQALGDDPFGEFLFDTPPPIARPLDARFLEHLDVIGWEIVDESGNVVDTLVPRETYKARFYLRVLKRLPGSWLTFLHIDGQGKRYNVDHAPLAGKYAMNLWQPGDVLREEFDVTLGPNFVPGEYWVFFGFFQGDTRMKVTSGAARDDRVIAGRITVE